MTNRYWFRPKRVGYGATPITWEGWLLTIGSLAIIGVASLAMVIASRSAVLPDEAMLVGYGLWLIVVIATIAVLRVVSQRRTDGEWRWRWRWSRDADERTGMR